MSLDPSIDLEYLCTKLKIGEYDGADIMYARIAIGELLDARKEIEKLKADAARLQFMSSRQARICWNMEGDLCDIWHIVDSGDEDSRWVRMVAGPFDSHNEAIDAAMKETLK